jgi:hypothetical protein
MGQYRVPSIKVQLFVCTALTVRFKFEVGTDRNAFSALVAVTAPRESYQLCFRIPFLPCHPHPMVP